MQDCAPKGKRVRWFVRFKLINGITSSELNFGKYTPSAVRDQFLVRLEIDLLKSRRIIGKKPVSVPISSCKSRSEEHTSELQSLTNLVCRLLLEKKKHDTTTMSNTTD